MNADRYDINENNFLYVFNKYLQEFGDSITVESSDGKNEEASISSIIFEAMKYFYLRELLAKDNEIYNYINEVMDGINNQIKSEHNKYVVVPGVVAENYVENNMKATELLNAEKSNRQDKEYLMALFRDEDLLRNNIPSFNEKYTLTKENCDKAIGSIFKNFKDMGLDNIMLDVDGKKTYELPNGMEINANVAEFIYRFVDCYKDYAERKNGNPSVDKSKADFIESFKNNEGTINKFPELQQRMMEINKKIELLTLCKSEEKQVSIKLYRELSLELKKYESNKKKIDFIQSELDGYQVSVASRIKNRSRINELNQELNKIISENNIIEENYSEKKTKVQELQEQFKKDGLLNGVDLYVMYSKNSGELASTGNVSMSVDEEIGRALIGMNNFKVVDFSDVFNRLESDRDDLTNIYERTKDALLRMGFSDGIIGLFGIISNLMNICNDPDQFMNLKKSINTMKIFVKLKDVSVDSIIKFNDENNLSSEVFEERKNIVQEAISDYLGNDNSNVYNFGEDDDQQRAV